MIALEDLQVVHLAVVGAVGGVGSDGLEVFPACLKVVFDDVGTMAFRAEGGCRSDAVAGMGRGNREDVAHAVELSLLLHGEAEFTGDLVSGKIPLNFATPEAIDEFLVAGNELGLVVFKDE